MKRTQETILPEGPAVPVVFDSPHSGFESPEDWHPSAPREALLTSWDAFVDELFKAAPAHGATLLRAFFPRSFIDLNRRRDDIDPLMLAGKWQGAINPGKKSDVGMGLLRRLALPGVPVYSEPLSPETVQRWIEIYYDPYHGELRRIIESLHAQFGFVRHIDCHSMKSRGNEMNDDAGQPRPDFVISDRDGTTSAPEFTQWVAGRFRELGYSVGVNDPYKGAELVSAYGDPDKNIFSIQIEVNRQLYMDEGAFEKAPAFEKLQSDIAKVIKAITDQARQDLTE